MNILNKFILLFLVKVEKNTYTSKSIISIMNMIFDVIIDIQVVVDQFSRHIRKTWYFSEWSTSSGGLKAKNFIIQQLCVPTTFSREMK